VLRSDPGTVALTPRPLSRAAVTELAAGAFADEAEELAGAVHEACGGNPLLVRELLGAIARDREPREPIVETIDRVAGLGTTTLARVIADRVAALGADAVGLARAVAILGDAASLPPAFALAGLQRPAAGDAADALAVVDVIAISGEVAHFAHPLVRSAVHGAIGSADREQLHARAARLLADNGAPAQQVASHLLHAPPGMNDEQIDALRTAAAAGETGNDTAATYLRRVLREELDPAGARSGPRRPRPRRGAR
jgi:hypothetical protein